MKRTWTLPAAAATILLVAGCGSTIEGGGAASTALGSGSTGANGGTASGPGSSGGLSVPGGTTPGGPGALSGPGAVAPGATGPGSTAPNGTGPNGSGGVSPGGTVTASGNGPGITPTTIYVGDDYSPQTATADAALGAANANPGDTKAETEAVIAYINGHGGIAHRKIVPVWYQDNLQDSAQTSANAACQLWTVDHKVFVLSGGDFRGASGTIDTCAAKEGALNLSNGQITMETSAFEARYPFDIDMNGLTNDRAMRYTILGLERLGYFSAKGGTYGIATWDDPEYHYGIDHQVKPLLAQIGLNNVPVEYISSPQSYGDLGATSSSTGSAVLQYNGKVNHVILFDGASGVAGGGVLTLEWMEQAHSQHYTPIYGLNSGGGFNALASDFPSDQLPNSVGVGWEPAGEQTSTDFATWATSPADKLCQKIMDNAGQHQSGANAIAVQFAICDHYFFLKRILDSMSGPITQATVVAAIDAVGTSYQPMLNFGGDAVAGHHDLPDLVRNMVFESGCTCYRYVGPTYNPG
jgi:hypothetical protein